MPNLYGLDGRTNESQQLVIKLTDVRSPDECGSRADLAGKNPYFKMSILRVA